MSLFLKHLPLSFFGLTSTQHFFQWAGCTPSLCYCSAKSHSFEMAVAAYYLIKSQLNHKIKLKPLVSIQL